MAKGTAAGLAEQVKLPFDEAQWNQLFTKRSGDRNQKTLIKALQREVGRAITNSEVRKLVELGKVGFADVEKALTSLANTKYANLMDRQNKTVLGQFSNLQDVIDETKRKLGKPLSNIVRSTTSQIIGYLEKFAVYLEENQEEIEDWVESFVDGIVVILKTLKNFGGYVSDFFDNTWAKVLAGALITWRVFATGVEMSAGAVIKSISAIMLTMGYLSQKVESEANKTVDGLSNLAKGFNKTAGQVKSFYDNIKNQISGGATGNIDLKTTKTTTTAEVSTKTTKEQKKKTGQDEKAKEKKLKADLLAIDKNYNTKKLNQQAKSVEKQNELNQLASWGYYDEAEKKIEAKKLELSSLKEANDLELEQQKEKLDLLREVKGEDNELVLEQEAEFRLMKAEQQAEFDKLEEERRRLDKEKSYKIELDKRNQASYTYKFNKFLQSKELKTFSEGIGELVNLQNSKSKKMREIGKAAAKVQIGIDTARGAMSAYNALAMIPFVGPALGFAAAAAVIAYGAERMAEVNSYAVGSPNIEQDQLANIHKGEIIVPKTFSDGLRDGDLMLGNAKSLENQQTDEQKGGLTIINNFEGANFYGVADSDEMIKQMSEAISENIADGLIQPFPTEQI